MRCYGGLVYGRESALLCAAVPHHRRDIIVDLSGVTAIDAAGIGALVSLQAAPTGIVFSGASGFTFQARGIATTSVFTFVTEDGTIVAWGPGISPDLPMTHSW